MRYAWIRDHAKAYPRAVMFRALQVSAGGYYGWVERKPTKRLQRHARIAESVKEFHARSKQVYGYRKVHKDIEQETEYI